MMKFKHRKSALALCITAMTAVSGGVFARDLRAPINAGDSVNSRYAQMVDLVESEAIGRQAYTLTSSLGKYGSALNETGWDFMRVYSTNEVPNSAKTVIYINASDVDANAAALTGFMAKFKGVVIVDSNWIQDDGWSKKLEELPPNADAGAMKAIFPEAALFYANLGFKTGATPNSTAIMRSSHERTTFPINFTADGLINGMTTTEFVDAIDLRITAAGNMAKGVELETSASKDGAKDFGIPDEFVDIYSQQDGWVAAGRYRFWAWRTQSGKKYVSLELAAGDNLSTCLIQNTYKCGVYPINRGNIISTTTIGTNAKDTISFATRYSAGISSYQATSLLEYRPSAAKWNATEAINSDSTWHSWSEGWSLGASVGFSSAGSWSLGASAGYSQSSSHTKRYTPWYGQSDDGYTGDGARYAWSGIHMNTERNVIDTFWPGRNDDYYDFETDFRGENFAGQTNICGDGIQNNLKPRSSFEGWNPSIAGIFEVVPATILGANYVVVQGHINWSRAKHSWKRESVTWHRPTYPGTGYKTATAWRLYNGSTAWGICNLAATPSVKDYSVKQAFTVWNGGTASVNYFNTIP